MPFFSRSFKPIYCDDTVSWPPCPALPAPAGPQLEVGLTVLLVIPPARRWPAHPGVVLGIVSVPLPRSPAWCRRYRSSPGRCNTQTGSCVSIRQVGRALEHSITSRRMVLQIVLMISSRISLMIRATNIFSVMSTSTRGSPAPPAEPPEDCAETDGGRSPRCPIAPSGRDPAERGQQQHS